MNEDIELGGGGRLFFFFGFGGTDAICRSSAESRRNTIFRLPAFLSVMLAGD
jgi:hypothetical protein